jgi:hypothetical protein
MCKGPQPASQLLLHSLLKAKLVKVGSPWVRAAGVRCRCDLGLLGLKKTGIPAEQWKQAKYVVRGLGPACGKSVHVHPPCNCLQRQP